ncbi:hypothetical protein ACLOJK_024519 [Asimina triloba]
MESNVVSNTLFLPLQQLKNKIISKQDAAISKAEMEREEETNNSSRRFFVAVHVSASYHAPASERPLRRAMKRACRAASAILRAIISLLSHL